MNDHEDQPSSDEPDSPGRPTLALDLESDQLPDTDWLARHIERAAEQLRFDEPDVAVIVIDDARMAQMHVEFSGVEGTGLPSQRYLPETRGPFSASWDTPGLGSFASARVADEA